MASDGEQRDLIRALEKGDLGRVLAAQQLPNFESCLSRSQAGGPEHLQVTREVQGGARLRPDKTRD